MGYALLGTIQNGWCQLVGWLLPSTMRKHLTVGMLEIKARNGTGTDSDYETLAELRTRAELECVPAPDLLSEVMGRYDAAYFVGTKDLTGEEKGISYALKGDSLRRMGLNDWVRINTFKEFQT